MSAEDFELIAKHAKDKFDADRKRFLADAIASDDGGWRKHSEFHWSRTVNNDRLDYWPSRKKYQHRGRVRRGDVYDYIKRMTAKAQGAALPGQGFQDSLVEYQKLGFSVTTDTTVNPQMLDDKYGHHLSVVVARGQRVWYFETKQGLDAFNLDHKNYILSPK